MQGLLKNFAVEEPFAIRRRKFFDGWSLRGVDSGNSMTTLLAFGLARGDWKRRKQCLIFSK